MSWLNELREEIKFTSPSALKARKGGGGSFVSGIASAASQYAGLTSQSGTFVALWRANDRSFEKKLGIFSPPHFQGDIVQDLSVKSNLYPITAYFDGMYHHKNADNFYRELFEEVGPWEVIHPVYGSKMLQLVSCKQNMNPVEAGNYTEFEMQWIEPAIVEKTVSLAQTLAETLAAIKALADDAGTLLAQLRSDIYSVVQAAANIFNKIAGAMDSLTSGLSATSAIAQDSYQSFRAAFTSAMSAYGVDDPDSTNVADALVNMALAPLDADTDYGSRQNAYSDMADVVFALAPESTTTDDYNKCVSMEFGITLALMATAQIAVTSEYRSRAEVVAAMDSVTDFFNSVVARIEIIQDMFHDLDIDKQYYSQTSTYTTLIQLYTLVFRYLLQQFYNLRTEKRFALTRPRSPIEITVTEYGDLGENDANYSLFLESNHLSGNDILILPAGREVKVYR